MICPSPKKGLSKRSRFNKGAAKLSKSDDRHLTEKELESLAGFGHPFGAASIDALTRDVRDHLVECRSCSVQLAKYTRVSARLALLKTSFESRRVDECPVDEEWLNLAAGITNEKEAARLLEHAIECDR